MYILNFFWISLLVLIHPKVSPQIYTLSPVCTNGGESQALCCSFLYLHIPTLLWESLLQALSEALDHQLLKCLFFKHLSAPNFKARGLLLPDDIGWADELLVSSSWHPLPNGL